MCRSHLRSVCSVNRHILKKMTTANEWQSGKTAEIKLNTVACEALIKLHLDQINRRMTAGWYMDFCYCFDVTANIGLNKIDFFEHFGGIESKWFHQRRFLKEPLLFNIRSVYICTMFQVPPKWTSHILLVLKYARDEIEIQIFSKNPFRMWPPATNYTSIILKLKTLWTICLIDAKFTN